MIYDDVIDKATANNIEDWFIHNGFPWYYNDITVGNKNNLAKDAFDSPQLVHLFIKKENGLVSENSGLIDYPLNLFKQFLSYKNIQEASLMRCKANLQMSVPAEKGQYNYPHKDLEEDHYVLLYYVNSSDGDTFLFDNNFNITKRIMPKQGRFVLFNGNTYHAGRNPIDSHVRIVINYDFKLPDGVKL